MPEITPMSSIATSGAYSLSSSFRRYWQVMVRSTILIYVVSILSILIGILNILLYFFEIAPGQIPTGAPFYLRMGVVFIVGIPMFIQLLSRLPPTQRPKAVSVLSLIFVLAISIIVMMLLLPSMTKTIGSWGE